MSDKYQVVWTDNSMSIMKVRCPDEATARTWYDLLTSLQQAGEKISRIKLQFDSPY